MLPRIHPIAPVLALPRLRAAERRLGLRLPAAYRAFLLRYNGGRPTPSHFRPADGGGPEVLSWFFAVHDGDDGLESLALTYRPYLHPDLLPIASDPFGNLVCIATRGAHVGQVFFWLHENSQDAPGASDEPGSQGVQTAPPTELPHPGCRLIASSLDALLHHFGTS